VYSRKLGDTETTLGVSGRLWRDALVLYDRDSGTLWSQIDGRALSGSRLGETLQELPSVVLDWRDWKALHPATMALRPSRYSQTDSRYGGYALSADLGITGTVSPDVRLPGKTRVLGVEVGARHAAVALGWLEEHDLLQDTLAGVPFLAVAPGGRTGRAFDRRDGDRTLTFHVDDQGRILDRETGSTWDPHSGIAIHGALMGRRLTRLKTRNAYWFVWARFHPETHVFD
jgi:hypothetical protein